MTERLPISTSDFEIPKEFEVVILKMLPEIEAVQIQDIQVTNIYNPTSFDAEENFKIEIQLNFKKGEEPKKTREEYSKEISNLFFYTYSDYGFVNFRVVFFHVPKYSNKDKFLKLFYKPKNTPSKNVDILQKNFWG